MCEKVSPAAVTVMGDGGGGGGGLGGISYEGQADCREDKGVCGVAIRRVGMVNDRSTVNTD